MLKNSHKLMIFFQVITILLQLVINILCDMINYNPTKFNLQKNKAGKLLYNCKYSYTSRNFLIEIILPIQPIIRPSRIKQGRRVVNMYPGCKSVESIIVF